MNLNGEIVKMTFEGKNKTCRKWANGLKIYGSEKIWTPSPWQNVYYHNIHRSSLKLLGHSKPNFIGSIYTKGESICL